LKFFLEDRDNPLGRFAIAEDFRALGHFCVSGTIRRQPPHFVHDPGAVGPHKFECPRFHPFGTFGLLTQDENRFAQGGGFLLHAAGVGQNKPGPLQSGEEFIVTQRLAQGDLRMPG
jgi:hypothetical protein